MPRLAHPLLLCRGIPYNLVSCSFHAVMYYTNRVSVYVDEGKRSPWCFSALRVFDFDHSANTICNVFF